MSPRFQKFLIVGALGTAIDFILFYLFHVQWGWHVVPANLLSYGIGLTNSFFINRAWTFADSSNKEKKRLWLILVYGYIGLAINTLMVWWLITLLPWLAAKTIAVIFIIFFNYLTNKYLIFKVK